MASSDLALRNDLHGKSQFPWTLGRSQTSRGCHLLYLGLWDLDPFGPDFCTFCPFRLGGSPSFGGLSGLRAAGVGRIFEQHLSSLSASQSASAGAFGTRLRQLGH